MEFFRSSKTELKRSLGEGFAKEAVAFLNTRDGVIYIGVWEDGIVLGVESVENTMRRVRDIIRDQILPFTSGLCEIGSLLEGDRTAVFVKVRKGGLRDRGRLRPGHHPLRQESGLRPPERCPA